MYLRLRNSKRPATDGPSPPVSEPSDTNMDHHAQIAERVAQLLRPQLGGMSDKLDTLIGDFAGLKAENAALKEDVAALKTTVARKDAQIENISVKYHTLESRVGDMEQAFRASNAMLFNVPEEPAGALPMDTVSTLLAGLPRGSADAVPKPPIDCFRLGKPRPGPNVRPRPIKLVFASASERAAFMKRGPDIRAKRFSVDVDLTPAQREARNLLRSRFEALKAQTKRPFYRGARLFFHEGNTTTEALGPRPPAGSPPPPPPPPPGPGPAPTATNAVNP